MLMLLEAVKDGDGVGLLSHYIVADGLKSSALATVLPEFPVPDLWVKAMVPIDRLQFRGVAALLAFLRQDGAGHTALAARGQTKSQEG